jgi:hypothetical protein
MSSGSLHDLYLSQEMIPLIKSQSQSVLDLIRIRSMSSPLSLSLQVNRE